MHNAVTAQQLTRKLELLDPPQQRIVSDFIDFLLGKGRTEDVARQKQLLIETSVWSEPDVRHVHEVQKEINSWRIPT